MKKSKLAVGIILYHPDINVLKRNLELLLEQTDTIVCYDNNSNNILDIEFLIQNNPRIVLIKGNENRGVAHALNNICAYLYPQYDWCIMFDQDSIIDSDCVYKYNNFILSDECQSDIGIICPTIYDMNKKNYETRVEKEIYSEVESCINSGACVNLKSWYAINGYDENLFCDLVDYDFCIHLKESNYKIIRLNKLILNHSIGKISVIHIGKKEIVVYNHNALRKKDLSYASVYLSYKYRNCKNKYKYLRLVYLRIIKRGMLVLLFEEDKIEKIKAMFLGVIKARKLIKFVKKGGT